MDVGPGLRLVRKYWLAIVIITLVACAVGYGTSYFIDPSYGSTASILVRAREARLLTSSGQDLSRTPGAIDSAMGKPLTETYSGLVHSRNVAVQVVNELKLDAPRPKPESFISNVRSTLKLWMNMAIAYAKYGFYAEPTPYERAVSYVQNNVTAQPVKDSFLIEITAHSDDPQLAQVIATSATRIFMDENQQRFREGAATYSSFLKQEMENFRTRANDAQEAVRQYKEQNGITDVSEQLRLSTASLQDAQNDLRTTNAALDAARARYASLQAALDNTPATMSSTEAVTGQASAEVPTTTSSTTVEQSSPVTVTVDVPSTSSTLETGRSSTTTTNAASTTTTRSAGSTTTTKSDTTTTQKSSSTNTENHTSVAPNKVYQDLAVSAAQARADIAGLQARRDSLSGALAQATAGSSLPEAEAKLSELQLVATTDAEAYKNIGSMYESALLNDAWGTEEVTLVDNPAVPLYPDGPKRYLFGLAGLLCGIVGGFGTTYLIDNLRGKGYFKAPRFPSPLPRPHSLPGSYASAHVTGAAALDATMHIPAGPPNTAFDTQSEGPRL